MFVLNNRERGIKSSENYIKINNNVFVEIQINAYGVRECCNNATTCDTKQIGAITLEGPLASDSFQT